MKTLVKLTALFAVVFALIAGPAAFLIAQAQDVTPTGVSLEPTAAVVSSGDTNITIEQPAAPAPAPAPDTVTLPSWALVNLSVLFIAGSAITAIVAIVLVKGSFAQALAHISVANKDAIEAAYEALPEGVREAGAQAMSIGQNLMTEAVALFRFMREVTDGKPNTAVTPPFPEPPADTEQPLP